jgi:pyridinium-3,5-bisthiocarboxylic acid mononucleotide nickel chelatase
MRVAYFDCARGISGGAAFAALLDAGADAGALAAALDELGSDGTRVRIEDAMVGVFRARRVTIDRGDEQLGSGLADMEALVTKASLPDPARDMAIGVYRRLAEAEARVHGSDSDAVRFHEVGSLRSFVGVLGTALALDDLGIERVVASPIPFGRGIVDTAHGRIPVPAPATLELLRGMPVVPQDRAEDRAEGREGELVTTTGAAILAVAASGSGGPPAMTIERIGYGAGGSGPDGILFRVVVGEVGP